MSNNCAQNQPLKEGVAVGFPAEAPLPFATARILAPKKGQVQLHLRREPGDPIAWAFASRSRTSLLWFANHRSRASQLRV